MDRVSADLRIHEAEQARVEREWESLTTSQKCLRVWRSEEHPIAREVLLAYIAYENDTAELGRVIALFLNDHIDEMY